MMQDGNVAPITFAQFQQNIQREASDSRIEHILLAAITERSKFFELAKQSKVYAENAEDILKKISPDSKDDVDIAFVEYANSKLAEHTIHVNMTEWDLATLIRGASAQDWVDIRNWVIREKSCFTKVGADQNVSFRVTLFLRFILV
jgi:hypothetical protein